MQPACCSSHKRWNVWIKCSHIICTTSICFFTTSDRNWLCLRLSALLFRIHYNQVLQLALEKCYLAANMAPEAAPQWSSQFLKNDKWSHRPLRSMHGGALHQQSKTVPSGPVELKGFACCFKKMTVQQWTLHIWLSCHSPFHLYCCKKSEFISEVGRYGGLSVGAVGCGRPLVRRSGCTWLTLVPCCCGGFMWGWIQEAVFGVTLKDLKQRETNGGRSESKRGQACVSGGLKRRVGADKLISGQSL